MGEGDTPSPDPAPPGLAACLAHARRAFGLVIRTSAALAVQVIAVTLIVALLPAAALYVSKLVVDSVVAAVESGLVEDRQTVFAWVVLEGVILAVLLAARRLLVFYKARLHAELGFHVNQLILDKAQSLSLVQVEDPAVQQQFVQARQFATSRPFGLVSRGLDVLQNAVTLASVAGLLITASPWLLAVVLAGAIPLFLGNLRFSGTAYRFYTGRTPQMRERSYLESLISGESMARERLHMGWGAAIAERYRELFGSLYGEDRQLQARQAWMAAGLGLIASAVFLGGKLWIVWMTLLGTLTLGSMLMLVGLLKQGQANVTALLAAFSGVYEDLLYLDNLFTLTGLPDDRATGTAQAGSAPGDGLRFEAVNFTYPGRRHPALRDISLHLAPGTRLGLVGANGSGKTTLVKLALGLYRPDSGRVTLDGLDLADWDPACLARRFGVLFQPFTSYKMTARDNIAFGAGLSDAVGTDQLMRAADAGLARDLVEELPQGLDTRLSKRFLDGLELSGGQWQRLAMARAHVNEAADILILDEPTAALDPAAEAEFMARKESGRSVILISHRLANLRSADSIAVLDKGCLIEHGSHDELMAKGGLYAHMFATQSAPYAP
ncbi:ABC transporter ATP-binding protein [Maricaulis sp. CAU 1757]